MTSINTTTTTNNNNNNNNNDPQNPQEITLTQTDTEPTTNRIPLPSHQPHPGKPKGPQPNPSTPLYFAYGSNLSPTQMRNRCAFHPDLSAKPVALARLDGWRWLICQAGYANVVPPERFRVDGGDEVPQSGEEDTVYGVLYEMARDDERLLDGYEGVDRESKLNEGEKVPASIRPREQGTGEYNKWYFPASVTKWLDGEQQKLRGNKEQTVLVYVDEHSLRVGPPKKEYIVRMERAIREAEELGFPKKWATEVMRKFL